MFSIGIAEAIVIGVIVLGTVGVQAGITLVLFSWARRVAARRPTPWLLRLRYLPVAGFVGFVLAGGAAGFFLIRAFAAVAAAHPEDKARALAEAISEAMNAAVLLGALSWLFYGGSVVASLVGSRRGDADR